MIKTAIFYMLSLLLLLGCGTISEEDKKNGCTAPKPQAIFSDAPSKIIKHSFLLVGQNAEENLEFTDGSTLSLFQTGCEKISQEFRFTLPRDTSISSVDMAVERLTFLANLDTEYMSFANWAQAVRKMKVEFEQQPAVEVEQGFFVGMDRINSTDKTLLIIKLYQR